MGSHSVTCHPAVMRIPPLPPAEAGSRFSDPGGMQGWVDLCYMKADRLGIKLATCKLQVQRPTTKPPRNIVFFYLMSPQSRSRNFTGVYLCFCLCLSARYLQNGITKPDKQMFYYESRKLLFWGQGSRSWVTKTLPAWVYTLVSAGLF